MKYTFSINRTIGRLTFLLCCFLFTQQTLIAQTSFSAVSNGLPNAYRMDVADLENDGDLDVVLTKPGGSFHTVEVYTNDGSGNFTKLNTPTFDSYFLLFMDVAFIDIDGDNDQDILAVGSAFAIPGLNSAALFRNDGGGTFTEVAGQPFSNRNSLHIAVGDLDNDNDLDVIVGGHDPGTIGTIATAFYYNDGSGDFSNTGQFFNYENQKPVIGKLDNNNINDYIISNYTNSNRLEMRTKGSNYLIISSLRFYF